MRNQPAGKSVGLSPKLQTFAAEWDARDALIRQTKNENERVSVPPFSVDLADYVNVGTVEGEFVTSLQDYYHIQQLVVKNKLNSGVYHGQTPMDKAVQSMMA